MNFLRQARETAGFTQKALAQKTGLSLRTIQRLEAKNKAPKGHSLQVLAQAFDTEPSLFRDQFTAGKPDKAYDTRSIQYINLSVLACFGLPFGNLILPFLLWRKRRTSPAVDQAGRKIINLQVTWSLAFYCLLCLAPFVDHRLSSSFSLILMILFVGLAINLVIVYTTNRLIQRDQLDLIRPPIQLL